MSQFSRNVSLATEAYAAYLNAPRGILDSEEQMLFDEDLARARAAMELAWLEATPVQAPGCELPASDGRGVRIPWAAIKRVAGNLLRRT